MPKRKASDLAFSEAQETLSDDASNSSSGKSSVIAPISNATSKKSNNAHQVWISYNLTSLIHIIS
jgi:hypothetical protein